MRAYPREVPRGAPMFVRAGIASSPDPDAFAAAASHVAVFEIRPVPPGAVKLRHRRDAPQNRAGCRQRRPGACIPQACAAVRFQNMKAET